MSYNRSAHTPAPDQQYVPMERRTVRTEVARDECSGTHTTYQQAFNVLRVVVDIVPPPVTNAILSDGACTVHRRETMRTPTTRTLAIRKDGSVREDRGPRTDTPTYHCESTHQPELSQVG
jgi:hypothetical protein